MPSLPDLAVAAFARRIALAGGLAAAGRAVVVVGVLGTVAALVIRWQGEVVVPTPWWALGLVPVAVAGWAGWRRSRPDLADAAAHLDQRLQLDGLLLVAQDGAALDDAWRHELDRRLAGWRAALPAPDWVGLTARPAAALVLAALAAFWPTRFVTEPPRGADAFGGVVQSLQQRLGAAIAQGRIPAGTLEAITGRLTELVAGAATADPSAWRELDGLTQRLAREELLAGAAPRPGGAEPAGGDAGAGFVMQQAIGAIEGLLDDKVPALARGLLERALRDAAKGDAGDLVAQAERMRGLAQRLLGDGDLGQALARLGLGGAGERRVQDLAARLRAAAAAVGLGGARARRSERVADADPDAPSPWQLGAPPTSPRAGVAAADPAPRPWTPPPPAAADPDPARVPSTGKGGAAWQLQVAPRHRGIVQRFFAAEPAAADKDKR